MEITAPLDFTVRRRAPYVAPRNKEQALKKISEEDQRKFNFLTGQLSTELLKELVCQDEYCALIAMKSNFTQIPLTQSEQQEVSDWQKRLGVKHEKLLASKEVAPALTQAGTIIIPRSEQ